jgi:chemotaxis protein CheC
MLLPTDYQLDAFKEIVNTGVGKAAASLNEMLDSHIELVVPAVAMFDFDDLEKEGFKSLIDTPLSCVHLGFSGSFTGSAALVFPPESASKLVSALGGGDMESPHLNGVMAGTLNEVGNIVINAVIGTIGNILAKPFEFSIPTYIEVTLVDLLRRDSKSGLLAILLVRTHFQVKDRQIEGNIFLIFDLGSFESILSAIDTLCEQ